ncbi:DUF805 domain-containing protein [Streptomyces sp. NBC_00094]|uniref:DUF805 domain-containing protein n=1 Tax=Streptomyces sp. NBC_00094 TaxID=2903620 RepID=UPI002259A9DC|nr:DUF805 domain-containing protein [Streptomyces sp. NBC_00094]MCX5388698.1 DUF805 domain-containing protein [Streptomyces sp. NBC_00094]
MNWYLDVLKRYADFTGRARRKEYWMYSLFTLIAVLVLAIIDFSLGTYPVLVGIYGLATLLPSLGVTVRRLHDTGRSGWWYLIALVPFVGGIVLLVFTVIEGDAHPNAYGADPKAS